MLNLRLSKDRLMQHAEQYTSESKLLHLYGPLVYKSHLNRNYEEYVYGNRWYRSTWNKNTIEEVKIKPKDHMMY